MPSSFDPDGHAPLCPWWDDADLLWKVKNYDGVTQAFHDERAADEWVDEQSLKPRKRGW